MRESHLTCDISWDIILYLKFEESQHKGETKNNNNAYGFYENIVTHRGIKNQVSRYVQTWYN